MDRKRHPQGSPRIPQAQGSLGKRFPAFSENPVFGFPAASRWPPWQQASEAWKEASGSWKAAPESWKEVSESWKEALSPGKRPLSLERGL